MTTTEPKSPPARQASATISRIQVTCLLGRVGPSKQKTLETKAALCRADKSAEAVGPLDYTRTGMDIMQCVTAYTSQRRKRRCWRAQLGAEVRPLDYRMIGRGIHWERLRTAVAANVALLHGMILASLRDDDVSLCDGTTVDELQQRRGWRWENSVGADGLNLMWRFLIPNRSSCR